MKITDNLETNNPLTSNNSHLLNCSRSVSSKLQQSASNPSINSINVTDRNVIRTIDVMQAVFVVLMLGAWFGII